MIRPLELFIGLRYTRAKRSNHFISFISLTSMLGIALGITALITVLSVMNGFDREMRERILDLNGTLDIHVQLEQSSPTPAAPTNVVIPSGADEPEDRGSAAS